MAPTISDSAYAILRVLGSLKITVTMFALAILIVLFGTLAQDEMDLAAVKQRYGSQLCLWGNLNPAYLTGTHKPEDITAKVRKILQIGCSGGGFIFGTSSGLFKSMKPEHVELIYESVRRFRPSDGCLD